MGEFIRLYLTRAERWESPKFLAGESYGTTRAAALSQYCSSKDGIYLNGITLISSVLNFETISFARGNDLPYALFLPTYTATAWYHKKLPQDLQARSGEGDRRSRGDSRATSTRVALMKGDKLTPTERSQRGAATGAPDRAVAKNSSTRPICAFRSPIHQGTAARGASAPLAATTAGWRARTWMRPASIRTTIPAMHRCKASLPRMFNDYVRADLKYDSDLPYRSADRQSAALELRAIRKPLRERRRDAAPGDDAEPEPEGD